MSGYIALDSDHEVIETIRIETTPEQERAITAFIVNRYMNPGTYTLAGRNCATFVVDALKAGGLTANDSVLPYILMEDIKQRYGVPGNRRR